MKWLTIIDQYSGRIIVYGKCGITLLFTCKVSSYQGKYTAAVIDDKEPTLNLCATQLSTNGLEQILCND